MTKGLIKEIGLGIGLAFIGFLIWKGYDVLPLMFILGFFAAMYFLAESKGLVKPVGVQEVTGKNTSEVYFDDIGGQASAIKELKEALDFIKNYEKIKELGIRPLKGILLLGPPGTGKTLMAKAAATYTDAVYIATSGSEFIEMYAGVGAQRVRKLFKSARDKAAKLGKNNAMIFIDEIEVVGGKRGQNSSHMEYDQTLNQLLVEMDGMKNDDSVKVLLIAATNRADMLDPALMRPGRFDRHVRVDLPCKDGRVEILKIHTRNKPLENDVELGAIARETFGFSGAHLESLTNEAAIYAFREGRDRVSLKHFKEAIDKVIMGEKLDKRPNADELKRVSIHETGHALISEIVKPGSVSTLTISPRGNALGYMRQTPEDDTYLYTIDYLENQISIMLAGALAEELIFSNRSTGASNDFEKAVDLAKRIILSGMSRLGVVSEDSLPKDKMYDVITEIIREQEGIVQNTLLPYRKRIIEITEILLEQEQLSGTDFRKLVIEDDEPAEKAG
ncbi:AAA family ATPase [Phosphitispora fastidiosa]|uniref:AAA family ATPase n=1 Tax=Phosphitispora fastidiosa TaxID=2837202 RepID=UPI003EBC3759|nr:vesicle-fusing ATPase [Phosphitispora fastidiosa]